MKKLFLLLFLFISASSFAQTNKALREIIDPVRPVGFERIDEFDSSRTYNGKPRHLQILTWYPAIEDSINKNTTLKFYTELTSGEINISDTSRRAKENAVNKYVNYYSDFGTNNFKFKKELAGNTIAKINSEPRNRKFPVIYFVQGRSGSPVENFAMYEFLASNGYVVVTIPAFGFNSRRMEFDSLDFQTQILDQKFVFDFVNKNFQNIEKDKQAYMGFSYGSITSLFTAMNNPKIKAVISLDGSIGYEDRISAIENFYIFEPKKFKIPILHLNTNKYKNRNDISLIDTLDSRQKYVVTFTNLSHIDFTSFGLLRAFSDVMKTKPGDEFRTEQMYLYDYVINFLEMALYKNKTSTDRFLRMSKQPGFPARLIKFEELK